MLVGWEIWYIYYNMILYTWTAVLPDTTFSRPEWTWPTWRFIKSMCEYTRGVIKPYPYSWNVRWTRLRRDRPLWGGIEPLTSSPGSLRVYPNNAASDLNDVSLGKRMLVGWETWYYIYMIYTWTAVPDTTGGKPGTMEEAETVRHLKEDPSNHS
jgi:hypothetical protein